jgi:phospho-N-acetylmuramoyl-pentapeptide-transferase
MIGFGAIGCWDDWCKISQNEGVSAGCKLAMQIGISGIIGWLLVYWFGISTELSFPFLKNISIDLGYLYIPWVILILVGCSNAVNLTDGLDGLAIGALMPNFSVFSIICYIAGNIYLAHYLHIPFAASAEIAVLGCALIGVSLGFLWYNTYPAQIFMGDVGSLALGAALGLMALISKQELLLPLAGGLFVMETLSVIIQVLSFRLLGRRIFKMAPIHHHFELLGWQEAKITIRFAIISLVLCLLALITLKVR